MAQSLMCLTHRCEDQGLGPQKPGDVGCVGPSVIPALDWADCQGSHVGQLWFEWETSVNTYILMCAHIWAIQHTHVHIAHMHHTYILHIYTTQYIPQTHCTHTVHIYTAISSHCFWTRPSSPRTILVLLLHIFLIALTDNKKPGSYYFSDICVYSFSLLWMFDFQLHWPSDELGDLPMSHSSPMVKCIPYKREEGSREKEPLRMFSSRLWSPSTLYQS